MEQIKIQMNFFGAFRQYGESCDLIVPVGSDVQAIKNIFAQNRQDIDERLIQSAALANQNTILTASQGINQDCELSILPPVCGG